MRLHRGILAAMLCLCSIMLVCVTPANSAVLYVKSDSAADGPGTSWEDAYHTVATAASHAASGDEIRVAAGTYHEHLVLTLGVSILGGFSGTGTTRDSALYPTILDGQNDTGGSVIQIADNATGTFLIDGFTIKRGKYVQGGGINIQSPNTVAVTISNNIIRDCANTTTAISNCYGAGVFAGSSNATISCNVIHNNTATAKSGGSFFGFGGGISCNGGSPVIVNNILHHNTATGSGAGIYCFGGSPKITNNVFVDNTATTKGGGIATGQSASPTVQNNIIAFNSSGLSKGISDPAWTHAYNCLYSNPAPGVGSKDYENGLPPNGYDIIDSNPLFVDRTNFDYHLMSGSPCIDRGLAPGVDVPTVDFDGLIRPQDGNGDKTDVFTDIGAFEYPINLSVARTTYTPGTAIALGGLSVTGVFATQGRIYIEMPDQSAGIRVDTSQSFAVGSILNVSGTFQVDATTGEKYVATTSSPTALHGSRVLSPLDTTHMGLSTKYGLLIRTTGTVTQIGPGFLYIDDGITHLTDGTKTGDVFNVGVRVQMDPTGYAIGDMLQVTAISSCFQPSGIQRILLPRDASDIVTTGHSYTSPSSLKTSAALGTTAQAAGVVITATNSQMGTFLYAEDPMRCGGIRIVPSSFCPYGLGTIINATGTVEKNANGELQLSGATIDYVGAQNPIAPLGFGTRFIGGAAFGNQDGVTGGVGVNNVGLLTVVWGSVTHSEAGFFYIDDGCGVDDGLGYKGIKVYGTVPVAEGVDPVGTYVRVGGVSSCEKSGDNTIRAILTRDPAEVSIVQ